MIDLPPVVDEFAENFDALPVVYPDRPDYRVVIVAGVLVAAAVGIEIQHSWPEDLPES